MPDEKEIDELQNKSRLRAERQQRDAQVAWADLLDRLMLGGSYHIEQAVDSMRYSHFTAEQITKVIAEVGRLSGSKLSGVR
jgi:alkylhydroperoxidase family enzyme